MSTDSSLVQSWRKFCKRAAPEYPEIFLMGEQLDRHYAESHRAYHTASHILQCLGELDKIRSQTDNPLEVELAIFFHDVVYNPKAADNEEQSAKIALETGQKMKLSGEALDRIVRLIEGTKIGNLPETNDERLMEDIDYSILGQSRDAYEKYVLGVHFEYNWVPENIFCEKREKFLHKLLEKEHLYYTSFFQERYDHAARENIKWEMARLKGSMS